MREFHKNPKESFIDRTFRASDDLFIHMYACRIKIKRRNAFLLRVWLCTSLASHLCKPRLSSLGKNASFILLIWSIRIGWPSGWNVALLNNYTWQYGERCHLFDWFLSVSFHGYLYLFNHHKFWMLFYSYQWN